MKYTRGRAGPESRLTLEISNVLDIGGDNPRMRGDGIATLKGGRLKAIDFLAQGKHRDAIVTAFGGEPRRGDSVDVDVRWTGGTAVTVTAVNDCVKASTAAPLPDSASARTLAALAA